MGILLLIVTLAYLLVVVPLGMWMAVQANGAKKAKWIALPLLLVAPFWRPLFCELVFKIVAREPLQEIHQTVESPESVYWQDDVWPGFDTYGRKWMVEQYLDGVHLKTLALSGDDGKIYLYRADADTFAESERMRPARDQKRKEIEVMEEAAMDVGRKGGNNKEMWERIRKIKNEAKEFGSYMEPRKRELQGILDRAEVFQSISQLAPMRYRVHFEPLDDRWREKGIYHADQVTITESATGKVIAYSRRYLGFAFWLMKFSDEQPEYYLGRGDKYAYKFDDKVLFEYADVKGGIDVGRSELRRKSFSY